MMETGWRGAHIEYRWGLARPHDEIGKSSI
jgi:hypothetical protein